jgi:hypothetical protein
MEHVNTKKFILVAINSLNDFLSHLWSPETPLSLISLTKNLKIIQIIFYTKTYLKKKDLNCIIWVILKV